MNEKTKIPVGWRRAKQDEPFVGSVGGVPAERRRLSRPSSGHSGLGKVHNFDKLYVGKFGLFQDQNWPLEAEILERAFAETRHGKTVTLIRTIEAEPKLLVITTADLDRCSTKPAAELEIETKPKRGLRKKKGKPAKPINIHVKMPPMKNWREMVERELRSELAAKMTICGRCDSEIEPATVAFDGEKLSIDGNSRSGIDGENYHTRCWDSMTRLDRVLAGMEKDPYDTAKRRDIGFGYEPTLIFPKGGRGLAMSLLALRFDGCTSAAEPKDHKSALTMAADDMSGDDIAPDAE